MTSPYKDVVAAFRGPLTIAECAQQCLYFGKGDVWRLCKETLHKLAKGSHCSAFI